MSGRRSAVAAVRGTSGALGWQSLPVAARLYAAIVIAAGAGLVATLLPFDHPRPMMFAILVVTSCLTSAWKVSLPLALNSGSTLSMSYAANLMALLLLSPQESVLVAIAGAWTQCSFNVRTPYPLYRTVFSIAAEALTMQATVLAFYGLGGISHPLSFATLPKAIVGAIVTYFLVNTGLVAGAIALSTKRNAWTIWRDDFLWSGPSFMVAGSAGAIAAIVVERGDHWLALLMLAPVYLTYRTYGVFLGRIEDERRHASETRKLHGETVEALTQARRAEQQFATEKERLAVTLRSIGDGVITTDLDGTILLINSVAEALTGWTQSEAAGKPLGDVFQNLEPETRKRCDHSVETLARSADRPCLARATILVARDQSERPIEEVTAPIRDESGRTIGMVVAFRDITEALQAQEERVRASRVASLGLLAGGIAHDFNNILTAVMGNVSIVRAALSPMAPAASALKDAEEACLRARQLTWRLLTFSQGGVPVKKTTAIPATLKAAANLTLRGTNVGLTWHIAPDLWTVSADENQLAQVFQNIVLNAQEAMPQGGEIEIRAENIIESDRRWEHALRVEPGPYTRVSITDSGIGIPQENLGRIFDPYFGTKQRGTGLGLATAYSIIKNHGGYVSVRSSPGRGTTIHVNLPASASRDLTEPARPVVSGAARRGRVLVMDDEASSRTLAVDMLRFLGLEAEVVTDGTAAIERYRRAFSTGQPFAAVMLDLVVPGGMGARETMEQLAEIDPAVNAIVVSGYRHDQVMTEFRDYGFKATIGKPFTLEELGKTLNSIMVRERTWTVH